MVFHHFLLALLFVASPFVNSQTYNADGVAFGPTKVTPSNATPGQRVTWNTIMYFRDQGKVFHDAGISVRSVVNPVDNSALDPYHRGTFTVPSVGYVANFTGTFTYNTTGQYRGKAFYHVLSADANWPKGPDSTSALLTVGTPSPPPPTSSPPPPPPPATGNWPVPTSGYTYPLSGCDAAADSHYKTTEFGAWRTRPVEIATTWVDNNSEMVNLGALKGTNPAAGLRLPLDVAIGAIDYKVGESWALARTSTTIQNRWRTSLRNLRAIRMPLHPFTSIRFAHEHNGNWYGWTVNNSTVNDFIAAWKVYRRIQLEEFPEAKLVFCTNGETTTGYDLRIASRALKDHFDIYGVDRYNQYPHIARQATWDVAVNQYDGKGAPKGLERHRQHALELGKPLCVSEWNNNNNPNVDMGGEAVDYIRRMKAWYKQHGGPGAGQIVYETFFGVNKENKKWVLYPESWSLAPQTAATYRTQWAAKP